MSKTFNLNPGSDEALAAGCVCPIIDNGHGRGMGRFWDDGRPMFWISSLCAIHVPSTAPPATSETAKSTELNGARKQS